MVLVQLRHGEVVGDHRALEAQLAAQQVGEDLAAGSHRYAVDRRVAVHHRGQTRLTDGRGKRFGVHLAQLPPADVHGSVVPASDGCGVTEEVFTGAHHAVGEVVGLHGAHVGHAHAGAQLG